MVQLQIVQSKNTQILPTMYQFNQAYVNMIEVLVFNFPEDSNRTNSVQLNTKTNTFNMMSKKWIKQYNLPQIITIQLYNQVLTPLAMKQPFNIRIKKNITSFRKIQKINQKLLLAISSIMKIQKMNHKKIWKQKKKNILILKEIISNLIKINLKIVSDNEKKNQQKLRGN